MTTKRLKTAKKRCRMTTKSCKTAKKRCKMVTEMKNDNKEMQINPQKDGK